MRRLHRHRPRLLLLAHAALALAAATACAGGSAGNEDDTWAVILSSSRYWLNYRHSANALAVYQAVRRCASGALLCTCCMDPHLNGRCCGLHSALQPQPAV